MAKQTKSEIKTIIRDGKVNEKMGRLVPPTKPVTQSTTISTSKKSGTTVNKK